MLKLEYRRSSVEVIADILRLGESGKTNIMYTANLSHYQLQKYINMLLKLQLIEKRIVGNQSVTYRVTQKGLMLLGNIDSVLDMLEETS